MVVVGSADSFDAIHSKVQGATPIPHFPSLLLLGCISDVM
jgi:hypothetical protein